jgi:hypothetical protein
MRNSANTIPHWRNKDSRLALRLRRAFNLLYFGRVKSRCLHEQPMGADNVLDDSSDDRRMRRYGSDQLRIREDLKYPPPGTMKPTIVDFSGGVLRSGVCGLPMSYASSG